MDRAPSPTTATSCDPRQRPPTSAAFGRHAPRRRGYFARHPTHRSHSIIHGRNKLRPPVSRPHSETTSDTHGELFATVFEQFDFPMRNRHTADFLQLVDGTVKGRAVDAEVGGEFGNPDGRGVTRITLPFEVEENPIGDFIATEQGQLAPGMESLADGGGVEV